MKIICEMRLKRLADSPQNNHKCKTVMKAHDASETTQTKNPLPPTLLSLALDCKWDTFFGPLGVGDFYVGTDRHFPNIFHAIFFGGGWTYIWPIHKSITHTKFINPQNTHNIHRKKCSKPIFAKPYRKTYNYDFFKQRSMSHYFNPTNVKCLAKFYTSQTTDKKPVLSWGWIHASNVCNPGIRQPKGMQRPTHRK